MSCHVPQGFDELRGSVSGYKACMKCGKTTSVMHDILHADGDPDHLCDDCCPAELKRKAVPQDVVDILTKE